MRISDNRIGDAELNGYVDGQLDAAGRIEVEDHLARHPELAARVMADLLPPEIVVIVLVGISTAVIGTAWTRSTALREVTLSRLVGSEKK